MTSRNLHKLSARRVQTTRKRGRHSDGGCLYFVVGENGTKRWVFLYKSREKTGKVTEIGLGAYPSVSLATARDKAAAARALLAAGRDPLANKRASKDAKATERSPTFLKVLDQFLAAKATGWRSSRHSDAWRNSLTMHAPKLMDRPINEVTIDDVVGPLTAIWDSLPETAGRVRARIEAVIDFAGAKEMRTGANPARWARLRHIMPRRRVLTRGTIRQSRTTRFRVLWPDCAPTRV